LQYFGLNRFEISFTSWNLKKFLLLGKRESARNNISEFPLNLLTFNTEASSWRISIFVVAPIAMFIKFMATFKLIRDLRGTNSNSHEMEIWKYNARFLSVVIFPDSVAWKNTVNVKILQFIKICLKKIEEMSHHKKKFYSEKSRKISFTFTNQQTQKKNFSFQMKINSIFLSCQFRPLSPVYGHKPHESYYLFSFFYNG